MLQVKFLAIVLCSLLFANTFCQTNTSKFNYIDTAIFQDNAHHWYDINEKDRLIQPKKNQPRYKANELIAIANNILLFQKNNGGWPKNYDMQAILTAEQMDTLISAKAAVNTTFDNRTTYSHIACLSKIYFIHSDERYKQAALKGLDFILSSQFANGGWPQYFPLQKNYSRYITYNDDAMAGIMQLLKNISDGKEEYNYIDVARKQQLKVAFDKGIDCILKTQINDAGKPTAWCQQHNEITLEPAWARKFEPPAICNGESVAIVLLLMSIKNPSKEIIDAVENAIAWFNESKILNTRVKTVKAQQLVSQYTTSYTDKVVEVDSTAPPIWTRYYELKTHRPVFCNRDSKVVYTLAEVDRERRDGYAWYTFAPQKALDRYKEWKERLSNH